MRRFIKMTGLRVCLILGRIFRVQGIPVLAYHSVADDKSVISTSCHMFEVQMRYLKHAGYTCISLHRLLTWITTNRTVPRNTVVLTFDDGLKDFFLSAWPVLKDLEFSATVFVPTDYIGETSGWYAHYGLAPVPMLSWEEINELADADIDIQSHGCSHKPLTSLGRKEADKEIRNSKKILEEGLGKPVDIFCCPQGAWNRDVATAMEKAGYRMCVGGDDGLFRENHDWYNVKRQALDYINLDNERTAILALETCLKGTFAWYVTMKRNSAFLR